MSQQLFYVAMAGLDATIDRVTAAANNLANRGTTAFKAQNPIFRAVPFYGQGLANRVIVDTGEASADFRPGALTRTGRDLDIAVKGAGWIVADGALALTRNGALSVSPLGIVETSDGRPVMGQGFAPIALPPLQSVTIGEDGTVSGIPLGQSSEQVSALNRIMLANPSTASLQRQ